MAISITRYVDITSGVGGAAQAKNRALIPRIYTSSTLVPTQAIVSMTTLQDVGDYFGTTSNEYKRAAFVFSYVSKNVTRVPRLDFASYLPQGTAPLIWGGKKPAALAALQAVTSGQMTVNIGSASYTMTAVNLSTAADMTTVASILQTAVRGGPTTAYTGATVTWDSVNNRFNLTAGGGVPPTGAQNAAITVVNTSTGIQLAPLIAWLQGDGTTGAVWVDGVLAQEPVDAVTKATAISNDYGSFSFVPTITQSQIVAVAQWNDAQNVSYIYSVAVSSNIAATMYGLLKDISGTCLTLDPQVTNEYPELAPMVTLGATDYTRVGSTQNYMYQQYALTASVTDNSSADTYDAIRVNYMGQTQQAGANISFYQRGVMMGLATDPTDINVFANEIWLKDAVTVAIVNLLLALPKVSANSTGQAQLMMVCQSVIEQARANGVISIGKNLNATQQAFITQITGDDTAWREVQSQGSWFNIVIVQVGAEYHAQYTLVYSKDDAVRKVTGSNILI